MAEYWPLSFLPWLTSILLDVAVGSDVVVYDLALAVFIISKISLSTKPTVILSFSTTALFQLWPTVLTFNKYHFTVHSQFDLLKLETNNTNDDKVKHAWIIVR